MSNRRSLDAVTDVAFSGGKVAAIGAKLAGDATVRDVAGKIVSPGLIDLHTHVYWGGTSLGVEAEEFCRTGGVTTFVDAGSAGPGQLPRLPQARDRALAGPHPAPISTSSFAGIFAFSKTVSWWARAPTCA